MEIYNKVNKLAKRYTPKFTDNEKVLLLSIIEEVKEIVENPKTDSSSMERKNATWELITEQYTNSALNRGFPLRTKAQLKRCWTNLKYRYKQSDSARKLHQLKTGGGPPIVIDDDEEDVHEKVRSIVPTIDFTLKNQWDSTSEIERDMDDMQHIFEEEIRNNVDFNKHEKENYYESSSGNAPCYLTASTSNASSANLNKKESNVQLKPLNALQNILPKNDKGLKNRLKCKDSSEESLNKKRKLPTGLEIKQDLRIQKLEESTNQQSELHTEKLRIIRKECEYWNEMKVVAKLEMQAMQTQLKYWRAKYSAIESDI